MDSPKVISVSGLSKSYRTLKAVDDISFEVREGELFAFLGLNGAGKSTTVNMLSGVLKKDEGKVLMDGLDMDKAPMLIKQRIGVVFQDSVLDRKLSVYDNLCYRAALYGITGERFKEKLQELDELLDLKKLLKRPIEKLSGGQRRRIDIARALLNNPRILFLDEPTTGLDPQTRLMVWNCLNKLRADYKLTIFLTTHYMEEASEADYVVILDAGKIVAEDTPFNLKEQYATDCIKVYRDSEELQRLIKKEKLTFTRGADCLRVNVSNSLQAKKLIMEMPSAFNDFEVCKGTMDDVFLTVTGKSLAEDRNHD